MKHTLGPYLLALISLYGRVRAQEEPHSYCRDDAQGVYQYDFIAIDERTIINLGTEYNGKVLVVVNVATF